MKTVKTIVIIISIITIAFFSIGLVIKETKYTAEVLINKPVAEVFPVFNDESKTQEWIPEFKSVEVIDKKLGKVGSTYKVIVTNGSGQDVVMKEKILAFVPNEKVTLNYSVEGMLKRNDFTFSEENGKTKIVQESICKSKGYIMSCMFPFFKSKFKAQDQAYLNNFKTLIEGN